VTGLSGLFALCVDASKPLPAVVSRVECSECCGWGGGGRRLAVRGGIGGVSLWSIEACRGGTTIVENVDEAIEEPAQVNKVIISK
jgi:hypothetical protein